MYLLSSVLEVTNDDGDAIQSVVTPCLGCGRGRGGGMFGVWRGGGREGIKGWRQEQTIFDIGLTTRLVCTLGYMVTHGLHKAN